ncbi:class I SAM-dependent methyltransferase [Paenibacillus sp. 1001270B_150601_E10]|uniref:class I SAM-dependent methyltransferase n=1 Tax=Paenibacillus sp. 1001270B_150601_E10 TaxID=2787079 RepID=UPI00189FB033|nr:methyltransferase domain-containing protein [Paenibacillus sp. 1001270B_150601_E10]
MIFNSYMMFLNKFIHNPKEIGSVSPSSRFLANRMVGELPWEEMTAVAELGSGTGAITRHIASQAGQRTRVFLFEKDEHMRSQLQRAYPGYPCFSNACHLVKLIQHQGVEQLDAIISGLPFFNFEQELREAIVEQVADALKPGGWFVAFQYTLQMKRLLQHHFELERIRLVPLNLPPAFVYVCRKNKGIQ